MRRRCSKIVIGTQFGDEGKGRVVDYLCSQVPDPMVVRFNGGHQAAHRVVRDNKQHIFTNFGSGTMYGAPTYWSPNCTIEPIGLLKELNILLKKDIPIFLWIDAECPITTPQDIAINQKRECDNKNGSVGIGFGTTIEREENYVSFTFQDLIYSEIMKERYRLVKKYYDDFICCNENEFIKACEKLKSNQYINITRGLPCSDKDLIFEGAQGLLLDQHYGFFPNVTRSNTGCKNISETYKKDAEIYLVTRAYTTRHGEGYFPYISDVKFKQFKEYNKTNEWMGKFKYDILNLDLIQYAIDRDETIRESNKLNLMVTCLDHLGEFNYYHDGVINSGMDKKTFLDGIKSILPIQKFYYSESEQGNFKRF